MHSDQQHNHTGHDIRRDGHPAALDAESFVIEPGAVCFRVEEEKRGWFPAVRQAEDEILFVCKKLIGRTYSGNSHKLSGKKQFGFDYISTIFRKLTGDTNSF